MATIAGYLALLGTIIDAEKRTCKAAQAHDELARIRAEAAAALENTDASQGYSKIAALKLGKTRNWKAAESKGRQLATALTIAHGELGQELGQERGELAAWEAKAAKKSKKGKSFKTPSLDALETKLQKDLASLAAEGDELDKADAQEAELMKSGPFAPEWHGHYPEPKTETELEGEDIAGEYLPESGAPQASAPQTVPPRPTKAQKAAAELAAPPKSSKPKAETNPLTFELLQKADSAAGVRIGSEAKERGVTFETIECPMANYARRNPAGLVGVKGFQGSQRRVIFTARAWAQHHAASHPDATTAAWPVSSNPKRSAMAGDPPASFEMG